MDQHEDPAADFQATSSGHVYTFPVQKRGRTLGTKKKRLLEIDAEAAVLREIGSEGIKRTYELSTIRHMDVNKILHVRITFKDDRFPPLSFKHETRASAEMFRDLVLSILEGPMRKASFAKLASDDGQILNAVVTPDKDQNGLHTPNTATAQLPTSLTAALAPTSIIGVHDISHENEDQADTLNYTAAAAAEGTEKINKAQQPTTTAGLIQVVPMGPGDLLDEEARMNIRETYDFDMGMDVTHVQEQYYESDEIGSTGSPSSDDEDDEQERESQGDSGRQDLNTTASSANVSSTTSMTQQPLSELLAYARSPELLLQNVKKAENLAEATTTPPNEREPTKEKVRPTPIRKSLLEHTYSSGSAGSNLAMTSLASGKSHSIHRMPVPHPQRPSLANVAIYTWNMNNNKPDPPDGWMVPIDRTVDPNFVDDIVVVAVQEYMFEKGSTVNATRQYWQTSLAAALAKREDKYVCLTHVDSWNRMLSVYVREPFVNRITNLQADTTHVGVGGVGANKGAIGIRFDLFDTSYCFVNCHLAAHQGEVSKRNQDFEDIVRNLRKLVDEGSYGDIASSLIHYLFFMGDLNYRIDLEREIVMDHVAHARWGELAKYDQLKTQQLEGKAFFGFVEGKLDFSPTYKYAPGVWESDRRMYSHEKNRTPSWCDRILVKYLRGSSCKIVEYCDVSSVQVITSDHSPIRGRYQTQLVHTSGLRGRETMLKMSRETDSLYFQIVRLELKPLQRAGNQQLPQGDWTCILSSGVLAETPFKSPVKKDTRSPTWKAEEMHPVQLLENKVELLAKKYITLTCRCIAKGYPDIYASSVLWFGPCADVGKPQSTGSAVSAALNSTAPSYVSNQTLVGEVSTNTASSSGGSVAGGANSTTAPTCATSELAATMQRAGSILHLPNLDETSSRTLTPSNPSLLSPTTTGSHVGSIQARLPLVNSGELGSKVTFDLSPAASSASISKDSKDPGKVFEFHETLLQGGIPIAVIDGQYKISRRDAIPESESSTLDGLQMDRSVLSSLNNSSLTMESFNFNAPTSNKAESTRTPRFSLVNFGRKATERALLREKSTDKGNFQ